ncbi:hypothetical protein ACOSQ3_014041 [Xanthoceras sorbifolium]
MATENNSNIVQPSIPRFSSHYDHWSMLMENFLRSKEYLQVIESGVTKPAEGTILIDAQRKELDELKLKDLKKINQQEKDEQVLKVTTENQAFAQHRSANRGGGRGRDRGRGYNDRRQQQNPEDNLVYNSQRRGRADFDGEDYEKRQRSMENVPQPTSSQIGPTNVNSPSAAVADVEEEQRLQRVRKRPTWMMD